MCALLSLLSVAEAEVESGTETRTETGTEAALSWSVCSLALGIECLFIFKHHKKYSIPRTVNWLDIHTPTHIQ